MMTGYRAGGGAFNATRGLSVATGAFGGTVGVATGTATGAAIGTTTGAATGSAILSLLMSPIGLESCVTKVALMGSSLTCVSTDLEGASISAASAPTANEPVAAQIITTRMKFPGCMA